VCSLNSVYPLFVVGAVCCIASGCALIVVVVLSGVVSRMVRWEVGWLSKIRDSTGVFHGGGVVRSVRSLMYQDLDSLKLSIFLMFFPRKRWGDTRGVFLRVLMLAGGREPLG